MRTKLVLLIVLASVRSGYSQDAPGVEVVDAKPKPIPIHQISTAMPELTAKLRELLAPAKAAKTTAMQTNALKTASEEIKNWLEQQHWQFSAYVMNVRHEGVEIDGTPRYVAYLVPPKIIARLPNKLVNSTAGSICQRPITIRVSEELGKSLVPRNVLQISGKLEVQNYQDISSRNGQNREDVLLNPCELLTIHFPRTRDFESNLLVRIPDPTIKQANNIDPDNVAN